jgi:predicted house-cleaning noncanonical NTP pyrophosphatase (MazG superfamily)
MTEFEKKQQDIVDKFKKRLEKVADECLSNFYCDVTPYAEIDAHINFKNALRDKLTEEFCKEIATEHTHYSWASTIRMKLLSQHKEQLQNKIIEDLNGKIERLQAELKQLYERRW